MGIENIRALVRPLVTVLFASAFVALTFLGKINSEAFITVASGAIAWWFKERSDTRAAAASPAVTAASPAVTEPSPAVTEPSPAVTERGKTQQQPEG